MDDLDICSIIIEFTYTYIYIYIYIYISALTTLQLLKEDVTDELLLLLLELIALSSSSDSQIGRV